MIVLPPSSVICLMGPTASGKTRLAIALNKVLPVTIISVDSTMIYRGMDIGTAKPSVDEQKQAPHQLIDIRDPKETYSAAQFQKDATQLIQTAFKQNRIPLLVGGTMLYFRALQQGLSALPEHNPTIRHTLNKEFQEKGSRALHAELQVIDPEAAKRIHPNDPQRIQRALEIYRMSGKTMTQLWQREKHRSPFYFINIVLAPSHRALLHQHIENRFHHMMQTGFLEEAKALFDRPDITADLPAMRAVGYRQAWQYFNQEISKEQMIKNAITATRRLAKRQLTWLRSWENITWFNSDEEDQIKERKVMDFLKEFSKRQPEKKQ